MEVFTKENINNFSESKYHRKEDAALSNIKGELSTEDLSTRVSANVTTNSHMLHLTFSVIRPSFLSTGKARFFIQIWLVRYVYFRSTSAPFFFLILPIFLFGKSDKLRHITWAFLPENLKVGEQKHKVTTLLLLLNGCASKPIRTSKLSVEQAELVNTLRRQ